MKVRIALPVKAGGSGGSGGMGMTCSGLVQVQREASACQRVTTCQTLSRTCSDPYFALLGSYPLTCALSDLLEERQ